jgi:tRNA(Ile)-lysidine synthase TilS/MesJ
MECAKCDRDAVMFAAYSGSHLCDRHLRESVERRIRRRIREDGLLDDATLEEPERWVIGLSGGKDSVVLTQILHDTFERDPRIELVALSIHEGIEGYRDESLAAC